MEWLNYHHLRYFWTVAKEGTLARAAEKLRVSPPSISEQVRLLEENLGEKLFQRSGRINTLTETGKIVLAYAEEIFSLGRELLNAVNQRPGARTLRFDVGVADSFPKIVTREILAPVFAMAEPVQVICREGKMEDLLAQLAAHRLDVILSDEPPSSSTNFRTFSHHLGESGTTFCAAKNPAARLRRGFPRSLHGAAAMLPAENTRFRQQLEVWFQERQIRPRVLAEFDDLALMRVVAAGTEAFIAVPSLGAEDLVRHQPFHRIGSADQCRTRFYAITAERRIANPAASLVIGRKLGKPGGRSARPAGTAWNGRKV